ncbi:MAG: M28 family peptidase, partial [Ignavibacteria bacterium]|nr:M28 family peptidase [Ignavibacteria bacterium]
MKIIYFIILTIFIVIGCDNKTEIQKPKRLSFEVFKPSSVPTFDSLSAFSYVQKQLSFGPRNPNSLGHRQAMNYLFEELRKFADTTFIQKFSYPGYDEQLEIGNIIASFNTQAEGRILLCAHWDTRPRAEKDENPSNQLKPILGANDGASGVA